MKKTKDFGYNTLITEINLLIEKYPFLSVTGLCDSILGRTIPMISIGDGTKNIFYLGGERGNDPLTPSLLLRFIRDIGSIYHERASVFGFPIEYILKNYKFTVLPMLNPDGREYCVSGIEDTNPLKERLMSINANSENFKSWKGNARGVDLRTNYSMENTEYELEQEIGNLCNFLRYGLTPEMLIVFSLGNENDDKLYYGDGESANKSAIALSQMGYLKREFRQTEKQNLILADWAISETNCKAFSLEFGSHKEQNSELFDDFCFSKYASIRKMFFCAPLLNKI